MATGGFGRQEDHDFLCLFNLPTNLGRNVVAPVDVAIIRNVVAPVCSTLSQMVLASHLSAVAWLMNTWYGFLRRAFFAMGCGRRVHGR